MLEWLSQDGKILLAARALRAFAYGFLSVIIAIYLKLSGFQELEIGIVLTTTLVSSALFTLLASIYADSLGRKRTLMLFGLLMATSGLLFATTQSYPLLLLAALLGTINVTGTEVGPFLSIEQAVIPQTCPATRRTSAFALYSTFGTLTVAVGTLLSGLPEFLRQSLGIGWEASFRLLFLLYSAFALVTIITYYALSKAIEVPDTTVKKSQILQPESRRRVSKLALLFAVDSFAGGFVLQSIVAFWFFTRFEVPLSIISLIFFAANMLTALSFLVAAKLAARIGLINTMVFTHIPSNLFLILVPLAPSFPLALLFYLARMSLSQMDVPTRQSYVVAIVSEAERTTAAGITNLARNISQATSPSVAGHILQFLSRSFPFMIGGGLKILYDLLLYWNFRKVKPPEEKP